MEKGAATAKVEMTVTPAETVRSVKEKVAAAQLIAFPEHKLVCGGEKLDEKKTLGDCGVTEASAVEFVLEATEDSVVTQLKELLKSRDLTCDELGLLYCYKHGVSTNQALKTIGIEMKLADFVKTRKEFVLEGGKISMVRDDTSLKPLSVAAQIEQILGTSNASCAQPANKRQNKKCGMRHYLLLIHRTSTHRNEFIFFL